MGLIAKERMVKGAAVLVVAMLIASVALLATPSAVVIAEKGGQESPKPVAQDRGIKAAQLFINRVRDHIRRVLELAERYNITIPENMNERAELAKQLLENATRALEQGRVREAIRLALRASTVFRPVAEYVIHRLPRTARIEAAEQGLRRAIELRRDAVERLNRTIAWLEERGVEVPDGIVSALANASRLLGMAEEELSKGNVSAAARLLGEASRLLGLATAWLSSYTGKLWARIAVAEGAVRRAAMQTLALLRLLNRSVDMLEANATDAAIRTLTASLKISQSLELYLERAVRIAAGRNDNVTAALETLLSAVKNTTALVNASLAALEEGDVAEAVENIEKAYSTLIGALENVGGKLRAAAIALHLFKKRIAMLKLSLDAGIRRVIEHRIALFADRMLKEIAAELHHVLKMVRSGRISRDKAIEKLRLLKHEVEELLKKLGVRGTPPLLLEKARALLKLIDHAIAELSSSTTTTAPLHGKSGKGGATGAPQSSRTRGGKP